MEIQHNYEIPFDSFEWKTTLHDILRDFFIDAVIKVIKEQPPQDLEWKDDENIVRYALDNNLLLQIMNEMEQDITANYLA